MNPRETYSARLRTLSECVDLISDGDTIITSGVGGEPAVFLQSVADWGKTKNGVVIHKSRERDFDYLTDESLRGRVETVGHFFAQGMRRSFEAGLCSFIPSDLHNFMAIRRETGPDKIFWCRTTAMDENGELCVPFCQMFEREAFDGARMVVCEVNLNPKYAPVRGALRIPIDRVAALYEVDEPLYTLPSFTPTGTEKIIGRYIADIIRDGDCIQLGLGGLPNAIAAHLADKNDLGIHSEMLASSMARLIGDGVITGKRKNLRQNEHVATFILGDENLYRVAAENEQVRLMPASYVNDPSVIAQNDNMVSVNTLIEIDLTGQICSESLGPRQYSGTGGADDFAVGALHSRGGRGIFAFESVTRKGISKIRPVLTPGSVVSVSRNHADTIVTEYGMARLKGRTVRERALALIGIARPDFREELLSEAKKLLYI